MGGKLGFVIPVVVQARMNSSRLPGKVLRPVAGKPMLQYVLDRLIRCEAVGPVVVATSREDTDTPVGELALALGAQVYRGSLDDVASRFRELAETHGWQAFMRISGDSPLLDREIVSRAAATYEASQCDLVTNVFPRTFPPGQSVEVLNVPCFVEAIDRFEWTDREHVTTFFYRNSSQYRIANFVSEIDFSNVRMAVDTEEDFERFSTIVSRMTRPQWQYGLRELLTLYPS